MCIEWEAVRWGLLRGVPLTTGDDLGIWGTWKWVRDEQEEWHPREARQDYQEPFWNMSFWMYCASIRFSSVAQLIPTLRPNDPQHPRPPCPSPTPRVHPNPCPLSQWCHPTISSSVVPISSCPQSFPASGSFHMSQLFASGGQSIGVSASTSVLPMNTQDSSPLGWTGWLKVSVENLDQWSPNLHAIKNTVLHRNRRTDLENELVVVRGQDEGKGELGSLGWTGTRWRIHSG